MLSNKKIIHAFVVISMLFLSLVLYLTYFQVFRAPELKNDGSNPRTVLEEQRIKRGDILSSDGKVLAYSHMVEDGQKRIYPYDNMYSHVIGYNSTRYGRSMLEKTYNGYIMGSDISSNIFNFKQEILGGEKSGADINLTIDHSLQNLAYKLLGNRKGSIIAIEPKTGATLALVSKPDFNPNEESLVANWEKISTSEEGVLLSRATSGLYAPGSSFKIVTAAAAVENSLHEQNFKDEGSIVIGGFEFVNYDGKTLGEVDIDTAFAKSSNVVFTYLADEIGRGKMKDAADRFMVGKEISYDIPLGKGSGFNSTEKTNTAAIGMGQGDLLVTPMNMALVGCAIANHGRIMQPYLVESATLSTGGSVYTHKTKLLSKAVSESVAARVEEMMIECVKSGTGTAAAVSGIQVAGKTGTAENAGEDHAWFVGYAPADDPEIVICVMIENAGNTGGAVCAPIVRDMIKHWCID